MAKQKLQPQAAAANAAYTPAPGDFEFLNRHDLQIDTNFASQSYWKGVFTHFFKNRRAVAGLVIITVIIITQITVCKTHDRCPVSHNKRIGCQKNDNY